MGAGCGIVAAGLLSAVLQTARLHHCLQSRPGAGGSDGSGLRSACGDLATGVHVGFVVALVGLGLGVGGALLRVAGRVTVTRRPSMAVEPSET